MRSIKEHAVLLFGLLAIEVVDFRLSRVSAARGIARRSISGGLLSIGLLIGYGGMLYGVLPGQPGISWLGHLCGFIAGIAGAWLLPDPEEP
ncbi:MAG: rhomboid family intramembrane serine protease [Verrucomicrobiota bacterium]